MFGFRRIAGVVIRAALGLVLVLVCISCRLLRRVCAVRKIFIKSYQTLEIIQNSLNMADDKSSTVASPVKATEEKEVVDGVEVGTTTPAKSPVKAKDCTDSTETAETPTNGAASKEEAVTETTNGDSNVDAAEPVVCPVKRKSAVVKEGEKEEDVTTPEKKAKKDEETTEVVEKETASA